VPVTSYSLLIILAPLRTGVWYRHPVQSEQNGTVNLNMPVLYLWQRARESYTRQTSPLGEPWRGSSLGGAGPGNPQAGWQCDYYGAGLQERVWGNWVSPPCISGIVSFLYVGSLYDCLAALRVCFEKLNRSLGSRTGSFLICYFWASRIQIRYNFGTDHRLIRTTF
jgi:hypothetical protein